MSEKISENLHNTFDASMEKGTGPQYTHPQSAMILDECKKLLWLIPTGQKLIQVMNQYNIPVQMIISREITFNVPDNKTVHIFCPNPPPKDLLPVALNLALGIRDVEQGILGYKLSGGNAYNIQSQADMDILFTKILDIITNMCKMAEEYEEEVGTTKLIDYVKQLGHAEFYKAYKDRKDPRELEDILKRLMTQG